MTTLAWAAVAEQLRIEIRTGKTRPSGELDTEAELCRRFSTSRITIRRALAELRSDGLITSQRGSGSKAIASPRSPLSLVIAAGPDSESPLALNRKNVRWRTMRPAAQLTAALRRSGNEQAAKGQWLRLTYEQTVDGVPFDDATVWFAPLTVPYVVRDEVSAGHPALLIEQAGLSLGRAIQTVSSGWNEARHQRGEPPEECVELTLERVMLTSSNEIAFVTIHRHRAALACLRIDLPTTNQRGDTRIAISRL